MLYFHLNNYYHHRGDTFNMEKSNTINIIHNQNDDSRKTAKRLREKLLNKGFKTTDYFDEDAFLNICIGGDGAFLRAIHRFNFSEVPFIGINTGHLGFFQEISPDNLDNFIDKLSEGKYSIEKLYLVEGIVCTRTSCIELLGINEIVVKGIESKTIHLNISINDTYLERFSGDGIIISTPMGSTGYNLSAGGSVVYPNLNVLQLTPLAPINSKVYRSLTSSAIIPANMYIKINPEYRDENSILIVVDGKQYRFDNIVEMSFKVSDMRINLLTIGKRNFWSDIKDKFL